MLYAASKSALTADLKGIAVMHAATDASELDLAAVAARIPGATIGGDAEAEEHGLPVGSTAALAPREPGEVAADIEEGAEAPPAQEPTTGDGAD